MINTTQSIERWESDAFESKELAKEIFEDTKKKLTIFPHPFCGWRSLPNQNLTTIKISIRLVMAWQRQPFLYQGKKLINDL